MICVPMVSRIPRRLFVKVVEHHAVAALIHTIFWAGSSRHDQNHSCGVLRWVHILPMITDVQRAAGNNVVQVKGDRAPRDQVKLSVANHLDCCKSF